MQRGLSKRAQVRRQLYGYTSTSTLRGLPSSRQACKVTKRKTQKSKHSFHPCTTAGGQNNYGRCLPQIPQYSYVVICLKYTSMILLTIRDDPFWRPGFVSADRVWQSNRRSIHVCQLNVSASLEHPRSRFFHRCQPSNLGFLEASTIELPPSPPTW